MIIKSLWMNQLKAEKYLLYVLLAVSLVLLPVLARDGGISGDEKVHYEHSKKVLSLGAMRFLRKPFNLDKLLLEAREVLDE